MWCGRCQQDVPAARAGGISALCPRCGWKLAGAEAVAAAAHPSDMGVALDSFDQSRSSSGAAAVRDVPSPGDAAVQLRRLGHKLRPALRVDRHFGEPWRMAGRWPASAAPPAAAMQCDVEISSTPQTEVQRSVRPAWGIGFLLTIGMLTLLAGVGSLAWSTVYDDSLASQWGITASLAGEGLLVIALARITLRLWRNSRRLVVQLDGVRGQLEQLERHGGPLPFGCRALATPMVH
jgi:hypothetical protein